MGSFLDVTFMLNRNKLLASRPIYLYKPPYDMKKSSPLSIYYLTVRASTEGLQIQVNKVYDTIHIYMKLPTIGIYEALVLYGFGPQE